MLAETQVDRRVADLHRAERESVENLPRRPLVVALDEAGIAVVLVAALPTLATQLRILFDIAVEAKVIPPGGAQAHAVDLLIGEIDLGKNVGAVHDHVSTVHPVVAFVAVGRVGQTVITLMQPDTARVLHRGVPVEAKVRISQIECHGLHRGNAKTNSGQTAGKNK
ncbi:hypothetical protein FQZ97_790190 [compost metagenome]